MKLPLYDAHNHLQDERLKPHRERIKAAVTSEGIVAMVVNGSCEADWPEVVSVAHFSQVIPSFGYHPWYVKERTPQWQSALLRCLDAQPSAIGEIGLDRWSKDFDLPLQEEMFIWQLRLAAKRNLPVSIHCLKAWGRMLEILQEQPRPACGFVLHSFGGPKEMLSQLTELGAYFSLPGYFAHKRKEKQRDTFRHVTLDRLLLETDAPDQLLPDDRVEYPLADVKSGERLNHPANLLAVYRFAAELLALPIEDLVEQVETNFKRVFGELMGRP